MAIIFCVTLLSFRANQAIKLLPTEERSHGICIERDSKGSDCRSRLEACAVACIWLSRKAQQKAIVNSIAKAVGAEHNGVSSIEWTNEDGGDFNTVEVYMYVGI